MGYTALLFCPDEKTARTVTQVLSELEFTVEACIEPFAAVKKLMGQHFDAVVVDCDNEQNATLLFKSARNSTSNQTSLAVAVVEGQAGVAKAFRIGANLVLTKPINIEQAKGTLRVARGLLRKSEPAKPAAPGAAPAGAATPATPATPTAAKPAAPKATSAPKPAPQPAAPTAAAPVGPRPPVVKPASTQAWPAAAAASSAPTAQDDDLLGIDGEESGTKPTAAPVTPPVRPAVTASPKVEKLPLPAPAATAYSPIGGGAASAPAPAREPSETKVIENPASAASEKAPEAAASQPGAYVGAAPTFSFGAKAEEESSGGNKKIFLGVAAALIVAAVGYFGWTQFKQHSSAPAPAQTSAPPATVTNPQPKPSAQPASATTVPSTSATPVTTAPVPSSHATEAPATTPAANDADSNSEEDASPARSKSPKSSSGASSTSGKTAAADKPEPAPLVVKAGKGPAAHADLAGADAPPPSMAGMATPGGAVPPPDLVTSTTSGIKPVLQTLSISQGVSQGLLYKKVAPTYPQNALRMRIEGAVELQATISKTGDISHIKVISGDAQLTKAATDAVKQWKYKPYLLNGEPVEIQTQVTINFKLPH